MVVIGVHPSCAKNWNSSPLGVRTKNIPVHLLALDVLNLFEPCTLDAAASRLHADVTPAPVRDAHPFVLLSHSLSLSSSLSLSQLVLPSVSPFEILPSSVASSWLKPVSGKSSTYGVASTSAARRSASSTPLLSLLHTHFQHLFLPVLHLVEKHLPHKTVFLVLVLAVALSCLHKYKKIRPYKLIKDCVNRRPPSKSALPSKRSLFNPHSQGPSNQLMLPVALFSM